MITNEDKEGWHYLAVKKTVNIKKRNKSKTSWQFYHLISLPSFRAENKLKCHEKICKSKIFVEL